MNGPFVWDIDPELINLFGVISLRYYSLLFVSGLMLGYVIVKRMYVTENLDVEQLDELAVYIFTGTVVGARLGHCLFYEPEYFLPRPWEIILPFKFINGEFTMTGFRGLASHGGILGVLIAIILFARKTKTDVYSILDKVSVAGALAGMFIRLGNFFNSEILGNPTGGDYGMIFKRVDNIARHPGQLYEALAYLLIFFILLVLYRKEHIRQLNGFIFGLFMVLLFVARFGLEYFKIDQVSFEEGMLFNMGQLLSLPFIIGGLIIMYLKRQPSAKA